jgi:hypothetical protein
MSEPLTGSHNYAQHSLNVSKVSQFITLIAMTQSNVTFENFALVCNKPVDFRVPIAF